MKQHALHKYLKIADAIERLIKTEAIKPGEKLPSVRRLSRDRGISVTTAYQAYYHLEGRGLIESKPQSGFYARCNSQLPGIPRAGQVKNDRPGIMFEDMIDAVFRNITSKEIINFSIASASAELLPGAKLKKSFTQILRNSENSLLNYEDAVGNPSLRKQIAKLSLSWDRQIDPDEIIVTAGCMEAISLSLKAVTRSGDAVAIESPSFFGIFQTIKSLNLKPVEIRTDPETGIDLHELEKAIKHSKIKACVFVPTFNNPLGSCMPDEKKKKLVELITKYQIPLIEDDIYGEIYFTKKRPKTCKSFDADGWVVYCTSVSKSLAAGIRIGWCLPGRFINEVRHLKIVQTISTSTLNQVALANFLYKGRFNFHLQKFRATMNAQCQLYTQCIIKHFPADIRISRPLGGLALWIELNQRIDGFELFKKALQRGISISPGNLFSVQGDYSNYIRIVFGTVYNDKVEQGLKQLGAILKER